MSDRDWLFSLEQIGIKLGLDQIRALLEALDHPDRAFPSIVIAGTNGKGSVTAMVERGLRAAGYRTGRYTSPHLVDLEERFAIGGEPIAPAELDRLASRIRRAAAAFDHPPSFFEATTALALEAFRDAGVNAAVLEVGLGGRLDATNAVDSTAVAITAVDFDHEAYLGHTLPEIAAEKAGVIKPDGLVVLGENAPAVREIVESTATRQQARLVYAPEGVSVEAVMTDGQIVATIQTPGGTYGDVRLGLRGRHQVANAVVAIRLLEELNATGRFHLRVTDIRTAVEDVTWPGRLERRVWRGRDVLIDGAHNPAGARALAAYLRDIASHPVPFVIGVMRDKHVAGMLRALAPVASTFICTAAQSPRALTPAELLAQAREVAPAVPARAVASLDEALEIAGRAGEPIVVAGSLYLAGEVRPLLSC
ncbi:MAG TPA: folylpolyglutamate synthase/dihydrofolate synthase family protein [Vicinamibacterales bacterium]|nr:folylpolyglutamate synthase/dihydrofolate synthase family protein [Vicinamibacterales bacterium]